MEALGLQSFLNQAIFLEAAGAVLKIVLSLNRTTVGKVSLPKSLKRSVAFVVKFHKMTKFLSLFLF